MAKAELSYGVFSPFTVSRPLKFSVIWISIWSSFSKAVQIGADKIPVRKLQMEPSVILPIQDCNSSEISYILSSFKELDDNHSAKYIQMYTPRSELLPRSGLLPRGHHFYAIAAS